MANLPQHQSKQNAIHDWLNAFMTACPEASVPTTLQLPYMTYSFPVGSWGDMDANMQVSIYVATFSEVVANSVCEMIGDSLGLGGCLVPCEGGALWLTRGAPFYQSLPDEPGIKRRLMNISIQYLTI